MIDLKGKTALVTGGSRGIGKEILLVLAKAGAVTCFVDLLDDAAEEVIKEVSAMGVKCSFYKGNVADLEKTGQFLIDGRGQSKKNSGRGQSKKMKKNSGKCEKNVDNST